MSQELLFERSEPEIGEVEAQLRARGVETIIGVDEAGRGPLAGPVVAGAMLLHLDEDPSLDEMLSQFDDSKKLDEATREDLYDALIASDKSFAVGSVSASEIDETDILKATFRAMTQAIEELLRAVDGQPQVVLVDGNMPIAGLGLHQRPVVGGDRRSIAIAAGSVLAKVSRDRMMREAATTWPQYGFDRHKGYGTAQHREALQTHGPCPLHRRTFAGVVES